MTPQAIEVAARTILRGWKEGLHGAALPAACRPENRRSGYAVQAALAQLSGERTVGWKIAATSAAGQQHIGVDGPLAGRLLASRVVDSGAVVPITHNLMRVAEAEFVFRIGAPLPQRAQPYTLDEVRRAVTALHPGIEVPDSRFREFERVGAAQLIADNACTDWFVLGTPVSADWRSLDLAAHRVIVSRNDQPAGEGRGAMVLDGPWNALLWIANELREYGPGLQVDDFVTTGTCIVPLAIETGDRVRADFGELGTVSVRIGNL